MALLTDGERAAYWVAGSEPGPEPYEIVLTGFSNSENAIYRMLENLEKQPGLFDVKLLFQEKVERDEFYKGAGYRQKDLVQYRIRLYSGGQPDG